jgi:hypothetical protein
MSALGCHDGNAMIAWPPGEWRANVQVAVHPGVEVRATERERRRDRLPEVKRARLGQAEHAVTEHL